MTMSTPRDEEGTENGDMTNQKEESRGERKAVILGTNHKALFFKQLCDAADKYERHVLYQDIHYLTIDHMGTEHVVELTDPGLARTGNREMAITDSDFAILYYSSVNVDSFQALQPLIQPLQNRKNLPILLVCDSDDVIPEETASAHTSSTSEGYESDDRDGMKRHYSMEQIRKGLDDNLPSSVVDQCEKFAQELGSRCSYMQISSSSSSDAKKVIANMIISLNKSGPVRNRRMSKLTSILRSKSSDKSGSDAIFEAVNEKKNGKKNGKVDDSKVCIVM